MEIQKCKWDEVYGPRFTTRIRAEMLSTNGLVIQKIGNLLTDKRRIDTPKKNLLVTYDIDYVIAKLTYELHGCLIIYPEKIDAIFAKLLAVRSDEMFISESELEVQNLDENI